MEAIVGFLGSAAFRFVFGWISEFFTKKQDYAQELELLQLHSKLDAEAASRELVKLKTLSDLNIKEINVKADADLSKIDAQGFRDAAVANIKPTGIYVVDLWNGIIRPISASIALVVWVSSIISRNFVVNDFDTNLLGVILGFYFASRSIVKGNK